MNEWIEGLLAQTEELLGFGRKEKILSLSQKTEKRVPYLYYEALGQVGQVSGLFWPCLEMNLLLLRGSSWG